MRRRNSPRSPRLALLLNSSLVLAAGACDGAPPPGGGLAQGGSAGVTIRDSAGIEIVENHAPEHPAGQFWTLAPEPEIVIGGEGGVGGAADDSAHLVWEVTGLARLVDGRVAVLSGGNRKLLLFEPSGRFSTSIGRGGRGPGEFSRPIHVQYLPPDTLVVWDEWFGPVSHFDTTGTLLGDRPIDLGRLMARTERRITAESALTPLLDGSFVVEVHASANPTDQTVLHSREHLRVDSTYALYSFGLWSWEVERGSVFRPAEPGFPAQVSFVDSEDTDGPIFAAGGYPPSIYISPGKKNEIHQFSPDGTLRRIIRRTTDPLPFTKEDREAGEERAIGFLIDGGVDEEVVRRVLAQANEASGTPEREFHPPISRLHLDTEGHLWVLDGVTAGGSQWSVFGSNGRWLGVLNEPSGLICVQLSQPCWMGTDFLLGLSQDLMRVEMVLGYRIRGRE